MKNVETIFFDFNGTLLNDLDLCLNLLNLLLTEQHKPTKTMEEYKDIFTFPIKEYYIKAGLDFEIESYESMAVKFIYRYKEGYKKCKLYPNTKEILEYLKNKGIKIICLSATEKNMLIEQLKFFGIIDYFDEILGNSDIYAKSKEDIAIDYINKNNIDRNKSVLIGDTLHDFECGKKMGVNVVLNYSGHQSLKVLERAATPIISDISILKVII